MQRDYGNESFNLYSETYGFTANIRFTLKCLIIRNPGITVLITLSSSVFILSYILRIFERPYFNAETHA